MGVGEGATTVGMAIRRARLEQGLSLRRLAQELHIGASTLSDYEQDRRLPSEDLLTACEKRLDLPAGELIALRRTALVARAADLIPLASPADSVDGLPPDSPSDSPTDVATAPETAVPTPPGAQPDRNEVPDPGVARPSRLHRWSRSLATAAAGAIIALAIQDIPPLLHHSGASPHKSTARPSPSLVPHALPTDNGDPRDSGCDADAVALSVADLNIYRPGRIVLGQTVAHYSPACKTIWPRFEPTAALNRIAPHARANKNFIAATSDFYVLKKGTTGGGCTVEGNYYLGGDFADYNSWSCSSIGTNQQEIIGTETAIGGATIKTCVDVKENVVPFRTFFSQCQTFTDV
jgi:transcriptional regulator with XRE-family HTH domain